MIDMTAEADMDTVAQVAYELSERLRDEDLSVLNQELVNLCRCHPVKAAQVLTALAAWFDPETPTTVLWQRVESITATRLKAAMA
jgi:hypothetical protein